MLAAWFRMKYPHSVTGYVKLLILFLDNKSYS